MTGEISEAKLVKVKVTKEDNTDLYPALMKAMKHG